LRYIILFIGFSIIFSQSLLDRLIVPFYIKSEFLSGYDNNYLKLSSVEKDSDDLYYILGDSHEIYSEVIRNKTNILYIPYIFKNHETRFDFRLAMSKYLSSSLKFHKSYYLRLSQHLAPYTWFKVNYNYSPAFYLKSYSQSDPYIFTSFEEPSSSYMPSIFSSEKISFEITTPVPYIEKTYFTAKYLSELQYYNPDFTEFDLKINNYYFKVKKRAFKYLNLSIAYMISHANNISYLDGLLSTIGKDRSFDQGKTYFSISANKFPLFGKNVSTGILLSIENRVFSSDIEADVLHFNRTHEDISINYWIKRYLNNNMALKLKGVYRNRATLSNSDYVIDLKSFEKYEIWLSIIFDWDINVY